MNYNQHYPPRGTGLTSSTSRSATLCPAEGAVLPSPEGDSVPVVSDRSLDAVCCSGVEICGLKASLTSRRHAQAAPLVETYQFVPHFDQVKRFTRLFHFYVSEEDG